MRPAAFASSGRWFRGNLHTHSDRSDGMAPAEQVIAAYRSAGYDFLVLTDHFEARWDWTVTDTSAARDRSFTTPRHRRESRTRRASGGLPRPARTTCCCIPA